MKFERIDWARLGVLAVVTIAGIYLLSQTRSDVTDLQAGQTALIRANRQALCAEGQFTAPPLRRAHESDRGYRRRIHGYALFRHVLLKGVDCDVVLATLSKTLPGEGRAIARTTRKILGLAPSATGGGGSSTPGTSPPGQSRPPSSGGGSTGTGGGTTGPPGTAGPVGPAGPTGPIGPTPTPPGGGGGALGPIINGVNQTVCMLLGNCPK